MKFKEIKDGIFFSNTTFLSIERHDIQALIALAKSHPQKRVRICAHNAPNDEVHEMFIVMQKNSYVRPHKHRNKVESFHIIEGTADFIEFNESGEVISVLPMSVFESGKHFFYRNPGLSFHTWNVVSDFLVIHEVTNGPFLDGNTIYAPWSPKESDMESVSKYISHLKQKIGNIQQRSSASSGQY